MAAFSGTAGSVVFNTELVDLVKEWSLDFSMSPPETTVFGETWDSFQPSVRNSTGSFSGYKNFGVSFPVQNTALQGFLAGSAIALKFYENATKYFDISTAYFTGYSNSVNVKGVVETTFNFQGAVAVTYN